jgi:hypothetical protein
MRLRPLSVCNIAITFLQGGSEAIFERRTGFQGVIVDERRPD